MVDKIQLLGEELIEQHSALALEILALSSKLGIPLGWHYLLDLIWIARELGDSRGLCILDAGGGLGPGQFFLAELGHRVISADMRSREPPSRLRRMFDFSQMGTEEQLEHAYLRHHALPLQPLGRRIGRRARQLLRTPLAELPGKIASQIYQDRDIAPEPERIGPLPAVVFYRTPLHAMPELADESVDAVISVSALEHNSPDDLPAILDELDRVTKAGGPILHTVSACANGRQLHAESHSWLLDEPGLIAAYRLQSPESNFESFEETLRNLRESRFLRRWLACSYFQGGKNGMPWGRWDPPYVPVGIRSSSRRGPREGAAT